MIRICLIFALFCLPSAASAGAWARDRGALFLAVSARHPPASRTGTGDASIYAEYGLRERLTLGAEFDQSDGARIFLRRTRNLKNGSVFANSVGIAEPRDLPGVALIETGLHWGRGFTAGRMSGWISVDGRVSTTSLGLWDHAKLDLLVGLKPGGRWMHMLSVETYADMLTTEVSLVPSVAWRVAPGKHLQLRYSLPVKGGAERRIALALWLEF